MRFRLEAAPFVAAFAFTLVVAAPLALNFAAPAAALDPQPCVDANPINSNNDDYGQVDGYEADQYYQSERGLWAEIKIPTSAACQRITSLAIFSPNNIAVFEGGVLRGYSMDAHCEPNPTAHSTPIVFNYRRTTNGAISCHNFTTKNPNPGDWEDFKIYGFLNGWSLFWKDENLQPDPVDLGDFYMGKATVNMERGSDTDSGYAYLRFINENHQSNGWTYTDAMTGYSDEDVDVDFHAPDPHTVNITP